MRALPNAEKSCALASQPSTTTAKNTSILHALKKKPPRGHNVLFQMITTLAFKVMKAQMTKEGDEINPQELHFLGRMLKDVMSSSSRPSNHAF